MELFVRVLPDDEKKWYPAECDCCGWVGSSEILAGGGAIADTGDYNDPYCPYCGSMDVSETDNLISITSWIDRLHKANDLIKNLSEKIESCDCSKHIYGHLEEENQRLRDQLKELIGDAGNKEE